MVNNNFVEFELSGGYFKTSHLRDKTGKKLYVDVEAAKKAGIPENSPRIVRWNDGTPVGVIELSEKKIECFAFHPMKQRLLMGWRITNLYRHHSASR